MDSLSFIFAAIIRFLMEQFDNDFIAGLAIKINVFSISSWRLSVFGLIVFLTWPWIREHVVKAPYFSIKQSDWMLKFKMQFATL